MRRLVTTVPAMVERTSLGHFAVIIHSPLYDPATLDVEVDYLLVGKWPRSVDLSKEYTLTLPTLPAVKVMTTLTHVGRVSESHNSYGVLAAWMEHHEWQMSRAGRELLIQLPQA